MLSPTENDMKGKKKPRKDNKKKKEPKSYPESDNKLFYLTKSFKSLLSEKHFADG
jgi:hypothetical protein